MLIGPRPAITVPAPRAGDRAMTTVGIDGLAGHDHA
jgi:hypothetical protein